MERTIRDEPGPVVPLHAFLGRRRLRGALAFLSAAILLSGCAPRRPDTAPTATAADVAPEVVGGVRRLGSSWVAEDEAAGASGGILVGRFDGAPYDLGFSFGRLTRPWIRSQETHLERLFTALVPGSFKRLLIRQLSALRLRGLPDEIPEDLLVSISGLADGYERVPPASGWNAYRRMLDLHALHDVSQRFVDAPALAAACTGFLAKGADGSLLLARDFDFEGGDIFDRQKLVSVVAAGREDPLPFRRILRDARRRLRLQPRGARRRHPGDRGRRDGGLGHAHDAPPRGRPPEREHVRRRRGPAARREGLRVRPDPPRRRANRPIRGRREEPVGVRRERILGPVARRHERGRGPRRAPTRAAPCRPDRRREKGVPASTSCSETAGGSLDVPSAVAILRDRRGADGRDLGPGNRNAIDASIAAHSIVLDLTHRRAWVAAAPHTLGPYVPVDLEAVLASADGPPSPAAEPIPADAWLTDGGYGRYLRAREALASVRRLEHDRKRRLARGGGARRPACARPRSGVRGGDGEARRARSAARKPRAGAAAPRRSPRARPGPRPAARRRGEVARGLRGGRLLSPAEGADSHRAAARRAARRKGKSLVRRKRKSLRKRRTPGRPPPLRLSRLASRKGGFS